MYTYLFEVHYINVWVVHVLLVDESVKYFLFYFSLHGNFTEMTVIVAALFPPRVTESNNTSYPQHFPQHNSFSTIPREEGMT